MKSSAPMNLAAMNAILAIAQRCLTRKISNFGKSENGTGARKGLLSRKTCLLSTFDREREREAKEGVGYHLQPSTSCENNE